MVNMQASADLPDWDIQKIVADKSRWHGDVAGDGQAVMRIAIGNLPPEQILRLDRFLADNGVNAEGHRSSRLGDVLRLKGADVFEFEKLQEKTRKNLEDLGPIGAADWKRVIDRNGQTALYADWESMSLGDRLQTQFRLTNYNIPFEVRASSTGGKVLAVTGENPMEMRLSADQAQKAQGRPARAATLDTL